ncbi:MAG: putative transporter, periplasmic substrate-binding protein [Rhodocyclales bacterium]|nr:putative transporter, periplasmic substrate-binding protein [Rhodocyclales bacterium]
MGVRLNVFARSGTSWRGLPVGAGRCILLALPAMIHMAFSAALAAEPPLLVLYDVRPPLVEFDGRQLQGSIGKRAQAALERAGIAFELREVPVQRQLLMIEKGLMLACSVARLKTAERMHLGIFSLPIAESPPYIAVVRRDATMPEPATLENWSAHPELRWGVQAGLYYSDYVQTKISSARAEITRFNTSQQHFASLLLAKRIDFVVMQEDEAQEMMKSQGPATTSLVRVLPLRDLSHGEQRFFYCSRSVAEKNLRALDQALQIRP